MQKQSPVSLRKAVYWNAATVVIYTLIVVMIAERAIAQLEVARGGLALQDVEIDRLRAELAAKEKPAPAKADPAPAPE